MNEQPKFVNRKYLSISLYTIFVFTACAILIKVIFNWGDIRQIYDHTMKVISPYLTGFFIAYLLNPFVILLDKWLLEQKLNVKFVFIRKLISIILTYILAIGFVSLVIRFVIPELYNSVVDIAVNKLPSWYSSTMNWLQHYLDAHPYLPNSDDVLSTVEQKLAEYTDVSYLTGILSSVWSTSVSVVKWVINLVIAVIVSIYLLADKNILKTACIRILYAFVPEAKAKHFLETLSECNRIFGGFIWGKTIDSLIIGILCLILLLIFRIPYAVLISVVVGVTNMVPYVGPYVGAVPGAFILLVVAPQKVIPYLLLILILQQFDGWILGPKILGDFTGLRPVLILFALSIGGAVGGIVGMFLGVPVVAVIQYLITTWINGRLKKRGITEETISPRRGEITMKDIFYKKS